MPSALPLPPSFEPVLPVQAAVALAHHVALAPHLVELGGLLRVRPLALELLVEGALLLFCAPPPAQNWFWMSWVVGGLVCGIVFTLMHAFRREG